VPEATNIAEELHALCVRLDITSDVQGDQFLAESFQVEAWSQDFFEVLSGITERMDALLTLIDTLSIRDTVKANAKDHLGHMKRAFSRPALVSPWRQHGQPCVAPPRRDPILGLSAVLHTYDFDTPTQAEAAQIKADANELLCWLEEFQLSEKDFIRECIVVGLRRFLFQIERLEWFGWGGATAGLKEVMGAYLALERGLDAEVHPQAVALMKKVIAKLALPLRLLARGREIHDDGEFALLVLQNSLRIGAPAATYVAGLLT